MGEEKEGDGGTGGELYSRSLFSGDSAHAGWAGALYTQAGIIICTLVTWPCRWELAKTVTHEVARGTLLLHEGDSHGLPVKQALMVCL